MSERTYKWYVEPMGSYTNRNIWIELLKEENASQKEVVIEGKMRKRNVWECEYNLITKLVRSNSGFAFNVYVQEGNGVIRPWKLKKSKI